MIGVVLFALGAVLVGQAFASRGATGAERPAVMFAEGFDRLIAAAAPEVNVLPLKPRALEVAAPPPANASVATHAPELPPVVPLHEEDAAASADISAVTKPEDVVATTEDVISCRSGLAVFRIRVPRLRFRFGSRKNRVPQTIDPVIESAEALDESTMVLQTTAPADESPVPVTEIVPVTPATDVAPSLEPSEDERIAQMLLADLPLDVETLGTVSEGSTESLNASKPMRSPSMSFVDRIRSLFVRGRPSAAAVFDTTLAEWRDDEALVSAAASAHALDEAHDATTAGATAAPLPEARSIGIAESKEVHDAIGQDAASATQNGRDDEEPRPILTDEFGISAARLAELTAIAATSTRQDSPDVAQPAVAAATERAEDASAAEQVEDALRMAQEAAIAAQRDEEAQRSRWAAELVGRKGAVPLSDRRKLLEFYLADPTDPESRAILAAVIAEDPELAPLAQSALAEAA